MASDTLPPPDSLDVLAARAAAALFRRELARGAPEGLAWAAAVELFRDHHPAWPLPLVEREAARTVGALVAQRPPGSRDAPEACGPRDARRPVAVPPRGLLRALAWPVLPEGGADEEPDEVPGQLAMPLPVSGPAQPAGSYR
ncbi:hypothetical protein [Roseomonas sp. BN140053]|uniref:hypothetical protein n=1 Tax=Roseomonas sp. BN140053 TaxID=3391898 RepID=UPI0039EBC2E7